MKITHSVRRKGQNEKNPAIIMIIIIVRIVGKKRGFEIMSGQ